MWCMDNVCDCWDIFGLLLLVIIRTMFFTIASPSFNISHILIHKSPFAPCCYLDNFIRLIVVDIN